MKIIASTLCAALLFLSLSVSAQLKGNGFDWYSQGKKVSFFPQDTTGIKYEWSFGDDLGGVSQKMKPTYTYLTTNRKYEVTLRIFRTNGDTSNYQDSVGLGTHDNSTILVTKVPETDVAFSSTHLYPNPASGYVKVFYPNAHSNSTIRLYDISGKQIMEQNTNSSQNIELNISHIPAGMYFIEISNREAVEIKKLQIVR